MPDGVTSEIETLEVMIYVSLVPDESSYLSLSAFQQERTIALNRLLESLLLPKAPNAFTGEAFNKDVQLDRNIPLETALNGFLGRSLDSYVQQRRLDRSLLKDDHGFPPQWSVRLASPANSEGLYYYRDKTGPYCN